MAILVLPLSILPIAYFIIISSPPHDNNLFLLFKHDRAPHILCFIDLSTVVNGQHAAKKPKLMNQAPDISMEALTPVGPIASPAASQMSNMANPKVIKISTRGRKSKGLKVFISFGNYHSGHTIIFFLNIRVTYAY